MPALSKHDVERAERWTDVCPEVTRDAARAEGLQAEAAASVAEALAQIAAQNPQARVLICGSLYLAGQVLKENDS